MKLFNAFVIFIVITTTLLFALRAQIERYEGLPVPPDCMSGGKLLGYPSPDNRIRLYDQEACSTIGGNYVPNGECLRKEGGSYSWDCRGLNTPSPYPPDCMSGGKLLGYPSPDNRIRLYDQEACSTIGGNYVPNGECLRKEGGSYSWDCRDMSVPVQTMEIQPPYMNSPVQTMEIQPPYMNSEIVLRPYNVMHVFNQGSCSAIGGNFLPERRYTKSYSIR